MINVVGPVMSKGSEVHVSTKSHALPGLEDDPEGSRIVAEEIRLHATVTAALETALRNASEGPQDDTLLLQLREDVSTAKPDDLPALFEQMHNLGALRAQRGKGAVGVIDRKSPYFGHLRLEEYIGGQEKPRRRDVLIGQRSYVDSNAGIRIVDWRNAPVSRIFYRYQEGDDYEEVLGDTLVEGTVLARRSVALNDGEIVRVSCPDGTFIRTGTIWKRLALTSSKLVVRREANEPARLGTDSDGRMRQDKVLPAIAALLDRSQYELITKPGAGIVAIQGSAGSGKTTVGLHRVAYLAETDPKRFRGDKMLVVVPNEALIHYVGRVLPALGVDGVPITTFSRFAQRAVIGLFPKLPSHVSVDTPSTVARIKSDGAMIVAINQLVARTRKEMDAAVSMFAGRWPEGKSVQRAWNAAVGAPDIRVSLLAHWLVGKRDLAGVMAKDLPDVTRGACEKLGQQLRTLSRNVVGLWDELCTSEELLRDVLATRNISASEIGQYLDWCVRQTRIRQEGERDGEAPSVDAEDHALLLKLYQSLRGSLPDADERPIRLAHLFVDEVQDASAVELRVLIELAGADPSVTLAGDIAQRMLEDGDERGEFSWQSLLNELGFETSEIEPLKVSYRSTAEITTFARAVLGPFAHDAEPIATRHGPPVELFTFASPGEAVAFLADALKQLMSEAPTANVAVVARFPQQAQMFYEGLERAEVQNVRRVSKQDFTWEAGVDVTDVRQTKGLEFDEVILVEANATSYPTHANSRHALYVGATRAAHQLWCLATEKASPLVTEGLAAIEAKA